MFGSVNVGLSEGKGRGIFANRYICKGETIDVSYSWPLLPEDLMLYEQTSIGGHWFDHPTKVGHGLLPIGSAALVNHCRLCNAELIWKLTELGYVGLLTATRDINVGEEIYIDYGFDIEYD